MSREDVKGGRKVDLNVEKAGGRSYPEFIESLKVTSDQEFSFAFTDALPEDDSTIEERIQHYGSQIRLLREEVRGAGISEEESVVALILCFFEHEALR